MSAIPAAPLAGRVAVVTGATSGIGFETAKGLAARGATTVVVGRGVDRARAAAQEISRATANAKVTSVGVRDLALMSETKLLADSLLSEYPKIHILVNNAGAYFRHREVTAEGHERTFALNVLSPFFLTSALMARMVDSAPARIVNVASSAHRGQSMDTKRLENPAEEYGSGYGAYGQSKLELILLTREQSRRLTGSGVTANAVHPGFVRSGFAQNNGGSTAVTVRFFSLLFGRSVRSGARPPIFVATDASLDGVTGTYFDRFRASPGSPQSQDLADARRLYESCLLATGAPEFPESAATREHADA
jgi:NAD(P)-dependent dehydrogenase (short-subunit alcohol dehydrogenase family)